MLDFGSTALTSMPATLTVGLTVLIVLVLLTLAVLTLLVQAYDRFQKLISQLELHGACVSKEDINQKFLRSLPPSWSQIALIMRNKLDIDEIDIDDLYNNLRNTNSTNEVSTASGDFGVSTAGGINQVPSTPSAHDIAYSFLAQPTTSPQLENKDFQQMDGDHLEELDLRWQVAMLTIREKKFIQRTGRNMDFKEKRHVSLDKSKIKCYNYGLGGYDWSNDFEVEPVNYALITISSSSSSSSSDSESKINRNEVIIEDWTSDDEDDVCAVKTVSSVKPNSPKPRVKNVVNTAERVVKPVWDYGKRGESRDLDTSIMHVDSEVIPKERAVNTACYVLNRPFGCPLTILNTLDSLGKFDGKSDEGYLLGYSTTSKAFRVYNKRTKRVEENLHINFLEDNQMWPANCYYDTGRPDSMLQDAQAQTSKNASPDKDIQDSEDVFDKEGQHQMPEDEQVWQDELEMMVTQELVANAMNDESRQAFEEEKRKICTQNKALKLTNASNTLPNDGIFNGAYDDDEDVGAVADFQNMDNTIAVSPIPILRIHNDHPKGQILGDPISAVQTRGKIQKAYFSTTKP
ncbi:ribonuclease H-like domain-containing protein [Tanacetum coccineum]